MGFTTYFSNTVQPVSGGSDGLAWAGVTGGSGTIAIAGGGVPVLQDSNQDWVPTPVALPVYTKPSTSDASYMLIGVPVPEGAKVGVKDTWVTCWEED
jgi:hypothetical protein